MNREQFQYTSCFRKKYGSNIFSKTNNRAKFHQNRRFRLRYVPLWVFQRWTLLFKKEKLERNNLKKEIPPRLFRNALPYARAHLFSYAGRVIFETSFVRELKVKKLAEGLGTWPPYGMAFSRGDPRATLTTRTSNLIPILSRSRVIGLPGLSIFVSGLPSARSPAACPFFSTYGNGIRDKKRWRKKDFVAKRSFGDLLLFNCYSRDSRCARDWNNRETARIQ